MISQHPANHETHLARNIRRKIDVTYSASTVSLQSAAHIWPKAPSPSWWFRASHLAFLGTQRPSQTVHSLEHEGAASPMYRLLAAYSGLLGWEGILTQNLLKQLQPL